ncbi:hypothetical protein L210DRAFT_926160 [Boletus edulis BED1]|uniref:Alpha-type protein kinase domain-containing protein n=1 Tax=Boletus edulis BED1 TaxID=1328754 RepID=A0AAD4BBA5_BOLED|nr:hypothetical protein L210DRAFT_926160 [Boletus edulis BED1]
MADFTPLNNYGPRTCQRCNVQFDASVTFEYVRGKDGTGRFCCPGCSEHYAHRRKAEEPAKPSGENEFTHQAFNVKKIIPDAALVKAMSAAQRGGRSTSSPSLIPGHYGYTKNHLLHQQHRKKMIAAASSSRTHSVMIRIALHHLKPEGKSGTTLVGNIERDIRVPLLISRLELRTAVIDELQALWIEWSRNYDLSLGSLEMYKSPMMMLYDPRKPLYEPNTCVLQEFFLRTSAKDLVPKFFANTKVTILLVMSHVQYEDIQLWRRQIDECGNNGTTKLSSVKCSTVMEQAAMQLNDPNSHKAGACRDPSWGHHESIRDCSFSRNLTSSPANKLARESQQLDASKASPTSATPDINVLLHPDSEQSPPARSPPKKRQRRQIIKSSIHSAKSSSIAGEALPTSGFLADLEDMEISQPTDVDLPKPSQQFDVPQTPRSSVTTSVPTQQQLKAAMQAQGAVRKQAVSLLSMNSGFRCRVYVIQVEDFQNLIQKPFNLTCATHQDAFLSVDTKTMIGTAGSFKTCHPGTISLLGSLVPHPSSAKTIFSLFEGSAGRLDVVAKRMFFRQGQAQKRRRYSREDELAKILDEANCLYWATSLMSLVYVFVDEMLATETSIAAAAEMQVDIPRLRVVHAAVAVPHDSNGMNSTTPATYLLEERIHGDFVKYINNNSAAPLDRLNGKSREIAIFLCFTQHVQYFLTKGMVYLSDFQGSGNLLTDCQVMTGCDFAENFGGGNCTEAFDQFKTSHQCNQFCRTFGLEPLSGHAELTQASKCST